jgi:small subunit ribosomal protein S8
MSMTDPIADYLTRLRNAQAARHSTVRMSGSRMKEQLSRILKEEGYIEDWSVESDGPKSSLEVKLKYAGEGQGVIAGIQRVSKPGCRIYCGASDVTKVLNGLGISIISTSKGVVTGEQARDQRIGGEVLCQVW